MILPILRWPDPVLSTPCAPAVLSADLRALAADMLETMYAAPGRGWRRRRWGGFCACS